MKVKPIKSSLRFVKCAKLEPRNCGPFEILEKDGVVSYQLELPTTIKIHNFFHVLILNKYVYDATHVVD